MSALTGMAFGWSSLGSGSTTRHLNWLSRLRPEKVASAGSEIAAKSMPMGALTRFQLASRWSTHVRQDGSSVVAYPSWTRCALGVVELVPRLFSWMT
jgi:hypothetical protein